MLLAALKRFDSSFKLVEVLGPECVDSVHRILSAFRKHSTTPFAVKKTMTPEALATLETFFGQYKHPNAAVYGLVMNCYFQSDVPMKALDLAAKASSQFSGEEATILYNSLLFEITNSGCNFPSVQILENMRTNQVAPNVETFILFLRTCANQSNGVMLALQAVREMNRIGLPPTVAIYQELANLIPSMSSAVSRHGLSTSILLAMLESPMVVSADQSTTGRVLSTLAGHAAAARDFVLLERIYTTARVCLPAVAGKGTSLNDTYFWESILSLLMNEQPTDVLLFFKQMPVGTKLQLNTYDRVHQRAYSDKDYEANLRVFEDVCALYPSYAGYFYFYSAISLLGFAHFVERTQDVASHMAVITSVYKMLNLYYQLGLDRGGILAEILLCVGEEEPAIELMRKLDSKERGNVLLSLRKRNKNKESLAVRLGAMFPQV